MKIYFHASVGQKGKLGKYYIRIVKQLEKLGYDVNATHVVSHTWEFLHSRDIAEDIDSDYLESMSRIQDADLLVFEISYPSSIVVGHFLTRALQLNKPVLGLYHESTTAALLRGWELERFRIAKYSDDDLEDVVTYELNELKGLPDQRFTMLLPGDLASHLDKLAEKGVNRSEYIRDLIRKDWKK